MTVTYTTSKTIVLTDEEIGIAHELASKILEASRASGFNRFKLTKDEITILEQLQEYENLQTDRGENNTSS